MAATDAAAVHDDLSANLDPIWIFRSSALRAPGRVEHVLAAAFGKCLAKGACKAINDL